MVRQRAAKPFSVIVLACLGLQVPFTPSADRPPILTRSISPTEMRDKWILDGEAELTVTDERSLKITARTPMALWCPDVTQGRVAVDFEFMVPEPRTKLLLLVQGCGVDGTPVCEWKRDGAYDGYNAGRMEVYTIAFNRGPHVSKRAGDQLANVRRIGGPEFADYTSENFRKHRKQGRDFWNQWNRLSLLGGAREPDGGLREYYRRRIVVDPPFVRLATGDRRFAELVDHRPNPLERGSVGFRCMSKGRTFFLRNVTLEGLTVASEGK